MRLDKYLKVSRLIKRRTVANEACDNGLVTVNGKPARASYEVRREIRSPFASAYGPSPWRCCPFRRPCGRAMPPPCTGRSNKFFYLPPCPHTLRAGRDLMTNDFNMPRHPPPAGADGPGASHRFRRGGCGALRRERCHYDHLRRDPDRHRGGPGTSASCP